MSPDSDDLLAQGTVDFRRAEREAASRGDGLDAPAVDAPDEREALVAAALQRFFGGHAEGEDL